MTVMILREWRLEHTRLREQGEKRHRDFENAYAWSIRPRERCSWRVRLWRTLNGTSVSLVLLLYLVCGNLWCESDSPVKHFMMRAIIQHCRPSCRRNKICAGKTLLLRPGSGFDYEIWTLDFHVTSFAAAIFLWERRVAGGLSCACNPL